MQDYCTLNSSQTTPRSIQYCIDLCPFVGVMFHMELLNITGGPHFPTILALGSGELVTMVQDL